MGCINWKRLFDTEHAHLEQTISAVQTAVKMLKLVDAPRNPWSAQIMDEAIEILAQIK